MFGLNIRSIVLACCFLLLPPARRVVAVVIVGIERFPFIVVVVEIIERKNNLAHLLVMTAFRHAINQCGEYHDDYHNNNRDNKVLDIIL